MGKKEKEDINTKLGRKRMKERRRVSVKGVHRCVELERKGERRIEWKKRRKKIQLFR